MLPLVCVCVVVVVDDDVHVCVVICLVVFVDVSDDGVVIYWYIDVAECVVYVGGYVTRVAEDVDHYAGVVVCVDICVAVDVVIVRNVWCGCLVVLALVIVLSSLSVFGVAVDVDNNGVVCVVCVTVVWWCCL